MHSLRDKTHWGCSTALAVYFDLLRFISSGLKTVSDAVYRRYLLMYLWYSELNSHEAELQANCTEMIYSVLSYFDTSAKLAGVQYEYNHKQIVYSTSTIQKNLNIKPGQVQL